ncbi:MAG TPA: hypothetical protein VNX21_02155 [Candidatus Thermoplasmatota archaeon]|nr:hypothetical protein [Candidatus Thermoplasmatota archaeon]
MRAALRKLTLLLAGFLGVLFVVALPSWGQEAVEPSGELATAECYGHHKTEGFRSMDLFPKVVAEAPKGQPFPVELTVTNPWLHELQNVNGYVNISGAPGLSFPGERDPVAFPFEGTVNANPGSATHDVAVDENATEMVVSLVGVVGTPLPGGRLQPVDYDLVVTSPDGAIVARDPRDLDTAPPNVQNRGTPVEEVKVDQTNLTQAGPGTWKVQVDYRGLQPQGQYQVVATVYYNLSRSSELILKGPDLLKPGESHTFTFTINAKDSSAIQALRYGARATAHHEHTDKAIGDYGDYDKWNTFTFPLGTKLEYGTSGAGVVKVDTLGPVVRRWGQVLGFAGSFLILPSLLLGGTFGKRSVEGLNRIFGSPRRRVLFHNAMSFWLLGLSLLHMLVFFYEAFWGWSHGLVWGGLALACMIGLGVTGATQRAFVAQWGFTRWRFVHFSMGVLVVVFVLVHMVADGSHLAPVAALFGGSAR